MSAQLIITPEARAKCMVQVPCYRVIRVATSVLNKLLDPEQHYNVGSDDQIPNITDVSAAADEDGMVALVCSPATIHNRLMHIQHISQIQPVRSVNMVHQSKLANRAVITAADGEIVVTDVDVEELVRLITGTDATGLLQFYNFKNS